MENKTGKYFKYAIGEIILVVIGILIALQINNWNENRKDRIKEIYYLNSLIQELDKNKSKTEFSNRNSESQLKSAEYLSNAMSGSMDTIDINELIDALYQCFSLNHPNYGNNVWNELQSTGNVSLIKNKELTLMLSDYYKFIEYVNALEKEWGETHLNYRTKTNEILDFKTRTGIFNKTMESRQKGSIKILVDEHVLNTLSIEQLVTKLNKIEGLSGVLSDIYINRRYASIVYENFRNRSEGIKALVTKEVESLTN